MTALYAAYRGELSKLLRRRKYIVFLVLGVLICIAWAVLGGILSGLAGRHGGVFISLTPTPMGALPFFLQALIPLFIFMGVTDLITVEGAEQTMRAMLYCPVERWKLYTGKLLAVMTYTVIYLAGVFIVSVVLSQTLGRGLAVQDIFTALAAYALTVVPLAVLAAFAAMIALLGRSPTLTMLILVVLYIAMNALPLIFPILSEVLFTSFLGWHRIWIGTLPSFARLARMLIIVLGYGVVFYTAGSLLFDRKEY